MKLFSRFATLVNKCLKWFFALSLLKKIIIVVFLGGLLWFTVPKILGTRSNQVQYQTAQVERGTLVSSVTASGSVSSGSSASITTTATGFVKSVYVKNGDIVTAGQKVAELTLDTESAQNQAAAWASYLTAQNNLNTAKSKMNSLQAALFVKNRAFVTDRGVDNPSTDQKADPQYIIEQAEWLQAESDYNNQKGVITQAEAAFSAAWLSYQQASSIIVAPTSGTVTSITLSPGSVIASSNQSSTSDSTSSNTSKTLGTITLVGGQLQASVNLSEIDVTQIKIGQKATLTLDAFTDKTFTGKVTSIDTNGSVSSGVTTYPATITFDSSPENIYPNMAVSAKIITRVKDNVLLVPSAAVQTQNGQSSVRIMRNGSVQQIDVEAGAASDTQTEIVSGVSEGDTVVTGQTGGVTGSSGQTSSPFGSFGGRGFGGGGQQIRIQR